MTAPGGDEKDQAIVAHLRRRLPSVVAIYRFGSTAMGVSTSRSDTDLAVLLPDRLDPSLRFDVQEELAALLGTDVDLIDLGATTPVMGMQVITGFLLYEGDAAARGLFEDAVFTRYARLNEERRGILQRVAAEGRVYG